MTAVPPETTPAPSPPTLPPSTTTTQPPASATTATSPTTTQPLTPPVVGSFAAWVGAGGEDECDPGNWGGVSAPDVPYVGLGYDSMVADVGRYVYLCFIGFDPEQPIHVKFTLPDGSEVWTAFGTKPGLNEHSGIDPLLVPVSEDGLACDSVMLGVYASEVADCFFYWLVRPHYQPGRYAIEAHQEDTIATGAFELVDPTEPWLVSVSQWHEVPRRDKISFVLSGFEPDQFVPLAFYTLGEGTALDDLGNELGVFELHSEAGTVQVDARGLGTFEADSSILPPGTYCLATPLMEYQDCNVDGALTLPAPSDVSVERQQEAFRNAVAEHEQSVREDLLVHSSLISVDVFHYTPETSALELTVTSRHSSETDRREEAWAISSWLAWEFWSPHTWAGGGEERFTIEVSYTLDLSGVVYQCSAETMMNLAVSNVSQPEWEAACR